jgi:WD40 repeat protein
VYQLAFTADGQRLVSGGSDGHVKLWDVASGNLAKNFVAGESPAPVFTVAPSPDGTRIATAGEDRVVRLWDVASGQVVRELNGHGDAVYQVAFNAAGTRLLSCGHSGRLIVWELGGGRSLFETALPAVAYSSVLSPSGEQILAACADGAAYVAATPAAAR